MNERPQVPEEERPLISSAVLIGALCLLMLRTLVGKLDETAPDDRPSTIVLGVILAGGAVLGWITPTGRLDEAEGGRAKAISGAMVISSASVALVGFRDQFPAGPLLALAIGIGWAAVMALRVVVEYLRERRHRQGQDGPHAP